MRFFLLILPIFFQIFLATRLPDCRRNLDSDKDMEMKNLRIGKSYLDAQVIQLVLLDDHFSLMSMIASTGLVVCEAAIGWVWLWKFAYHYITQPSKVIYLFSFCPVPIWIQNRSLYQSLKLNCYSKPTTHPFYRK